MTQGVRATVAGMLLLIATAAGAQVAETATGRGPARQQRRQQQLGRATPNDRQLLQRRVRQAFAGVVQKQLNLNPAQMQTLQRTDQKYEQQRRGVVIDERNARLSLKAAMEDSSGHPDQDKIAESLDQLVRGQRRRAELLEAEQKELSTFLSPLQRAQYFSLKERLTKKLLEVQRDSTVGRGGAAPPIP
jgi:hypothetical protein